MSNCNRTDAVTAHALRLADSINARNEAISRRGTSLALSSDESDISFLDITIQALQRVVRMDELLSASSQSLSSNEAFIEQESQTLSDQDDSYVYRSPSTSTTSSHSTSVDDAKVRSIVYMIKFFIYYDYFCI